MAELELVERFMQCSTTSGLGLLAISRSTTQPTFRKLQTDRLQLPLFGARGSAMEYSIKDLDDMCVRLDILCQERRVFECAFF